MEEKKTKVLNSQEGKEQQRQKPTYEQLTNYCNQLYEQNKRLIAQVQEINMNNMFKRLDYLFVVLQNKACFDEGFVAQSVKEIKEALTLRDDTKEAGKKEGE